MARQAHSFGLLSVLLLVLLAATACANVTASDGRLTAPLQITAGQASQIARNSLDAYNSGDYSVWSRDWSSSLKAAIRERDFLAVRERLMDHYGRCSAISGATLEPSPRAGFVRWTFTAECQSGQLQFIFAFPEGGNRAESVYVEPIR